jgi:hypothetical protein
LRFRLFALIAIAVLFCSASAFYFVRYLVKPFTGLVAYYPEVKTDGEAMIFSPRLPDSPAVRSGMVPDRDRILEINNMRMRNIRDLVAWDAGYYLFEPFIVTVEDDAGMIRTVSIKPELSVSQSGWFFILFFLVILGGTALYLFLHYSRETSHVIFAFLSLFYMFYTSVLPFFYENILTMIFVDLGELTAWLILLFLAYFQRDVFSSAVKRFIIFSVIVICSVFMILRSFFYLRWQLSGANEYYNTLQIFGRVQNECDLAAYILILFLLIVIYLKTRHKDLKHQIEWLTAGTLLAIPPHFFFDQLPLILGNIQNNPIFIGNTSSLFLSFLPLSYIIGLVRARGYKLKVFQSRLIVYIVTAFVLIAFFSAAYHPVQLFFTNVLKLNPEISGFIIAISIFIAALYFQIVIFLIIDNRLLRERQYETIRTETAQLEDTRAGAANAMRAQNKIEVEAVIAGMLGKVDHFFSNIHKSYLEIEKLFFKKNAHPSASTAEASGETKLLLHWEKIFDAAGRQFLALDNFKKRFDVIRNRRTSIQISFSLDTLIDSVIAQSKRKFSHISISYTPYPGLKVFCSPEEISLCCLLILENSYEAQNRKDETIAITIHSHHEQVTIEIMDKGNGIPRKNIPLVGQPFFTTKRDHDGLGLYFCRMLVERNNGVLSIEQGEETGTRVLLHIPKGKTVAGEVKNG